MKKIIIVFVLFSMISLCQSFAQKVTVLDGYACISAQGMRAGTYEDRTHFLLDNKRVPRHQTLSTSPNQLISQKFIVSPTDIDSNGTPVVIKATMTWAQASGWGATGNNMPTGTPVDPADTGCPMYKGKDSKPEEQGKWRLPTQLELYMIFVLSPGLEKSVGTNFKPFSSGSYWSSTENGSMYAYPLDFQSGMGAAKSRTYEFYVRCIRDL